MKEANRIIYISDDGIEFISKEECLKHEKMIKESRKIAQKYNDIIDFCKENYEEGTDDMGHRICENELCIFYNDMDDCNCLLNTVPCLYFERIRG